MFQEALIESLPHRSRSVGTVIAAASVHAVALGAITWISLQAVRDIEDPPEPIVFIDVGNPPPLGNGGSGTPVVREQPQLATLKHTIPDDEQTQPAPVQNRPILPATSNEVPESRDAEPQGEGQGTGRPGDQNGVDGGTGKKAVASIGTEKYVYEIPKTPGVIPPVLVSRIEPTYPEAARKLHLEGIVVLQAVIDISGRVDDLRVVKSAGELLDAAAIAAVEKWMYKPATLNGRTVKVYLAVTVDFKLH